MKLAIIAVGTELLMGEVVNSNAAWISEKLAALGVDVHVHYTVGDNPKRIQRIVGEALAHADGAIFTGGLGPTEDDLTVATLADYFQTPLVNHPPSEARLREFFEARGQQVLPNNLKQALKPQAAAAIVNPMGTAPGMAWITEIVIDGSLSSNAPKKPVLLVTFPGVPKELYSMWAEAEAHILAFQRQLGETPMPLFSEHLQFFGLGESRIVTLLHDLMDSADPTIAPYVGRSVVRLRLATKAPDAASADAKLAPLKATVIERLLPYYIGDGQETLEQLVGNLLKEQGLTVAVAESCTGGLISSRLTDIPGSSAYVHYNVVTYSNAQKTAQLDVPEALLAAHGAVSAKVAAAMADGILAHAVSNVAVSCTGIAGPDGGSDDKPVGLAYLGFARVGQPTLTRRVMIHRHYPRVEIKHWFSQYALHYLRQLLLGVLENEG